jgi:NAD(P)-dependent dehydrogenase (short-subunit alcohol dehydrogenase family)
MSELNAAGPAHTGMTFTNRTHSKAEGRTDPANIKLPSTFTAVVTGAGKGLGFNIALAYAKAGAGSISISSRTQSDLDALTKELKAVNPNVNVLANICDTTKDADVRKLADDVWNSFGRADVVVANAVSPSGHRKIPQGVVEDDDFERVIDINLVGVRRTAKFFVPLLSQTKDGAQAFIGVTSLAAHSTDSQLVSEAYVISKIAMNRLAELMHNDHFERDGVVTFAVHPGAVVTPQTVGHSNEKGDVWEQSKLSSGFSFFSSAERLWLMHNDSSLR